jgi:hypothetical protein
LLGEDVSHGIVSFRLFLVIDSGYLEPVAVNDVLPLPSGQSLFDYIWSDTPYSGRTIVSVIE